MNDPIRVLFLCTGNSARSQMAEGLLRFHGKSDFEVYSAGTDVQALNPLAVEAMGELGVDISHHRSKHLQEFAGQQFDYIITVCEKARDQCPTFPGDSECIHWGFSDPAVVEGDEATRLAAFRQVRNDIAGRLRLWILAQQRLLREQREGRTSVQPR